MNNGNVTMVTMIVENSQIQSAVDLQRCMNCEMQLNVVLNAYVAVHSSTFQRNKTCISLSKHLYVYCIQLVYTHTKGHASPYHQCSTHFTFPTDTLQTKFLHFAKITQAILTTLQFKILSQD